MQYYSLSSFLGFLIYLFPIAANGIGRTYIDVTGRIIKVYISFLNTYQNHVFLTMRFCWNLYCWCVDGKGVDYMRRKVWHGVARGLMWLEALHFVSLVHLRKTS